LSEQSRHLRQCMDKLSDKAHSLVELRYMQGLKPLAIAQQIGSSANTVSNALSRVRETLRDCIKRQQQSEGTQ
ncbi:MAG: sigma-70 family RNA polymerase sigma factor, partial [Phycisphaeraceae bacterium]